MPLGAPPAYPSRRPDGAPDAPLAVDAAAAAALADWFGFATSVSRSCGVDLEAGRAVAQLWPEHFDLAFELGDADAGTRANYGASPGDADHPEPYLYVGPWDTSRRDRADSLWTSRSARRSVRRAAATDDARSRGRDFFGRARRRCSTRVPVRPDNGRMSTTFTRMDESTAEQWAVIGRETAAHQGRASPTARSRCCARWRRSPTGSR